MGELNRSRESFQKMVLTADRRETESEGENVKVQSSQIPKGAFALGEVSTPMYQGPCAEFATESCTLFTGQYSAEHPTKSACDCVGRTP